MAVYTTTQLDNGHTLTVVDGADVAATWGGARRTFRVEERNELGTFLHVAFSSFYYSECAAWVDRAAARGVSGVPS